MWLGFGRRIKEANGGSALVSYLGTDRLYTVSVTFPTHTWPGDGRQLSYSYLTINRYNATRARQIGGSLGLDVEYNTRANYAMKCYELTQI